MANSGELDRYGSPWTRDELICAFDLYCRIPFRRTKASTPEVVELAALLKRSPASVARKLGNFGSFDPELQKRHITGLPHASRLDREVWDEYHADWNELVLRAQQLRDEFLAAAGAQAEITEAVTQPHGPSERETVRKARIHQQFFRQSVLSSYEETCCVTGLRLRECLVASHIIPWSVSEQFRTDPRNGLCLSATFDRLFDCGLVSVTTDLLLNVSQALRDSEDRRTREMICAFHGAPIIRPRRFLPLADCLEWHRQNVFHG